VNCTRHFCANRQLFVLYPISAFPVFFGLTRLVKWRVISQQSSGMVGKTVYAPLGWVLTHSDVAGRVFRFLAQPFEEKPKPQHSLAHDQHRTPPRAPRAMESFPLISVTVGCLR
jgi:hypothetical protein